VSLEDVTLTVLTDLHDRRITGGDSVIASVPDAMLVPVDGGHALDLSAARAVLRNVAELSAAAVNEPLHHADFVITSDPAVVESHGNMHPGCEECGAGVRAAKRMLRTDPTLRVIVGQCFWAEES